MALIYQHQPDELPGSVATTIVEESGWWGLFQQTATAITLAAALAASAFAAQPQPSRSSDEPSLRWQTVDEDFWVTPTPPIAPAIGLPTWIYDEQTPFLFGAREEDYWINQVAPVSTIGLQPPSAILDEQTPFLHGEPDEDLWQVVLPPPLANPYQPQFDTDDLPQQAVAAHLDEDYWLWATFPPPAPNIVPQQWNSDMDDFPIAPAPPPGALEMNLHIGYRDAMTITGGTSSMGGTEGGMG